jgi:hypothetical protein
VKLVKKLLHSISLRYLHFGQTSVIIGDDVEFWKASHNIYVICSKRLGKPSNVDLRRITYETACSIDACPYAGAACHGSSGTG